MPITKAEEQQRAAQKEKSSKWNPFHKKKEDGIVPSSSLNANPHSRDSGYSSTSTGNPTQSDTSFRSEASHGPLEHRGTNDTFGSTSTMNPSPLHPTGNITHPQKNQTQETSVDNEGHQIITTTTTTTTTTTISTSGPNGTHTIQIPNNEVPQHDRRDGNSPSHTTVTQSTTETRSSQQPQGQQSQGQNQQSPINQSQQSTMNQTQQPTHAPQQNLHSQQPQQSRPVANREYTGPAIPERNANRQSVDASSHQRSSSRDASFHQRSSSRDASTYQRSSSRPGFSSDNLPLNSPMTSQGANTSSERLQRQNQNFSYPRPQPQQQAQPQQGGFAQQASSVPQQSENERVHPTTFSAGPPRAIHGPAPPPVEQSMHQNQVPMQSNVPMQSQSHMQTQAPMQPHTSMQSQASMQPQAPMQSQAPLSHQTSAPLTHPTTNTAPLAASQPAVEGHRSAIKNLKSAALGIHGATEALRGTLNYSIDKNFGHTDPAILEQERQVIAKGKAEIDPRYIEKFNQKFGGGGVARKPVGNTAPHELPG